MLVDSPDTLWVVYVVVAVESVLGTVIEPCRAATAAALVAPAELMSVNQRLGVLSSLARLVGGPLGGLAIGLGGIGVVVLADAATFLLTTTLLATGRRPRPAHLARGAGRAPDVPLSGWRGGVIDVARTPVLRRVMPVACCAALAQGGFVVLFVLFVVRDLQGDEAAVGILRGVQAIGALAGGVLLSPLVRRVRPARMVAMSLAAFGLLTLVIWNGPLLTTDIRLYVALFIAVGAPGLALTAGLLTLLQEHSAEEMRGRVLALFFAVFGGVQAVGMLLAGLVGTGAGLTVALQVQGVLYLVAAVLALRLRTTEASRADRVGAGRPTGPCEAGRRLRPAGRDDRRAVRSAGRRTAAPGHGPRTRPVWAGRGAAPRTSGPSPGRRPRR